jgi:AcrR family transcriptional regulator
MRDKRPKLRRQDSNLNYLNQNQRCCRLHHDGLFTHDELTGPRQQTLDGVRALVAPSGSEEYSNNRNPQTDTLSDVAVLGKEPDKEVRAPRARMTGSERRHQLIGIARSLFAERGYDGTSIEEIAQRANVSKPVVYEHFGGKEGLYAVVVDREMSALLDGITSSLTNNRSRVRVELVALALLTYVEERTDGFRIMIRDSPASISSGTYSSLLNDAVSQVSSILAGDFARRGLDPDLAPLYAQALVGSVSMTAQWWLDTREPKKEVVAAHLVNLMWNGLTHLEADPRLQDG